MAALSSITKGKTVHEEEALSFDNENESPRLQQNDVNEEDTLVIDIEASFLQVGKNNSIEPTKQKLQTIHMVNDESDQSDEEQRRHLSKKKRRKRKEKTEKTAFHKSLGPVNQSAADRQFFVMSDHIMVHLQTVRDEGLWDTFNEEVIKLSRKYRTSPEAQIIILIERGQAACYSNNFKDSKKLLKQAIREAGGLKNGSLLIGRACYYLSAVYRRQKKNGKAIDYVDLASQNFHRISLVLDTPMLTYERASATMDFLLQCADPRPGSLKEVMSYLRRTIDQIYELQNDSSEQKRYLKTHRYAFIKMAMLLLDCRTATGRQRPVSEENVKEAEKHLDVIRQRYWEETKRGEKIQFFLAQSDLHYRKKLYEKAEKYALEALSMAEEFGFNTEIQLVNERLQDIRQASALARRDDDSHSNKKLTGCLNGNHDNSKLPITCDHDNNATHSNVEPGSSKGYVSDLSSSPDTDMLNSSSYI